MERGIAEPSADRGNFKSGLIWYGCLVGGGREGDCRGWCRCNHFQPVRLENATADSGGGCSACDNAD